MPCSHVLERVSGDFKGYLCFSQVLALRTVPCRAVQMSPRIELFGRSWRWLDVFQLLTIAWPLDLTTKFLLNPEESPDSREGRGAPKELSDNQRLTHRLEREGGLLIGSAEGDRNVAAPLS